MVDRPAWCTHAGGWGIRLMKAERTLSAVLCLARQEASPESFHVGKEMSIFFWGKSSGSGVEGEFVHLLPSCEDGQGEAGLCVDCKAGAR